MIEVIASISNGTFLNELAFSLTLLAVGATVISLKWVFGAARDFLKRGG